MVHFLNLWWKTRAWNSLGDWKAAWSCSSNLEKYIFWSCGREASALQGTTVLLTVLVNWSCLTSIILVVDERVDIACKLDTTIFDRNCAKVPTEEWIA
jgi:hypothetical protein